MNESRSTKPFFHNIGIIATIFLAAFTVLSQSIPDNPSRGSKVGNSYSVGDLETINLTNGNLMINFPLGSLPRGRGEVSDSVSLVYNSKLYDMEKHRIVDWRSVQQPVYFEKTVVLPSSTGGWRWASGFSLELEDRINSYGENPPGCSGINFEDNWYELTYRHKLHMVFPDGSKHEMIPLGYDDALYDGFYSVTYDGYVEDCGDPRGRTGAPVTYYTTDGTYLRLEFSYDSDTNPTNNTWSLYFPAGNKVTSAGVAYDRNGNSVNFVTHEDQLERSVDISNDDGDTLITTPGVNGEDVVWRVKWKHTYVKKTYQSCPETPACPEEDYRNPLDAEWLVVDKIIQPEQLGGGEYTFEYNGSNSVVTSGQSNGWGELSGITLPSGAHVSYEYTLDGEDGPTDLDHTKDILRNYVTEKTLEYDLEYDGSSTAATPEIWTYSINQWGGSVTGPSGAGTTEEFGSTEPLNGNLPWNSGLSYRSTASDGTKTEKIWARNLPVGCNHGSLCTGTGQTNPYIKTEFTSIKSGSSYTLTAIKDYTYDKNGNVTEIKEYDWMPYSTVSRTGDFPDGVPSGASGYLKRITKTEFYNPTPAASSTTYTDGDSYHLPSSERLLRLAKSVEVQDASGTPKSRSEIVYDHTNYDSSNTKGGNAVTTYAWDSTKGNYSNPLTSSNWITSSATYNDYGMPLTTTDANGVVTTITYGCIDGSTSSCPSGAPNNLYPTKTEVASNYSSLKRTSSAKYDFYTGVVTEAKDVDNNVVTVNVYDDLGRPTIVKSAYGTALESWVQTDYDDEERRTIVRSDLETKEDGKKVAIQHFDQLGRVCLSRTLEDAATEDPTDESDGIKVQTRYRFHSASPTSSNGEYTLTSNPFRATASSGASGEPTMGWTVEFESKTGNYKSVELFSGSGLPSLWGSNTNSTGKSEETEDANATTTTDETGKVRRALTNALGQLIRVDEPNSSGSLGTVASPNQDTNYSYDTLGNLTQIVQGGQTRTFTYSSLSRLLAAANPESGTFQFAFDSNGNLTSKTDARSVSTTFTYDALNRATARNYSDSTPDVTYTYDDSQVPFSKGKLTKVASSVSESLITSYDAQERVTGSQQKTDGQTYSFGYTYNLDDDLLTQTYPSGKVVEFGYDSSGDLSQVAKSNGFVYANSFSYAPHGQVEKMRFGNDRWKTTQFNGRRQITQIGLGFSATDTGIWKTNYEYGDWQGSTLDTTKNNNSLARQTITVPNVGGVTGFTAIQTYSYDPLDRLKSATETTGGNQTWKQTFLYDRFGNRNFDTGNTTLLSNESTVAKIANPEILTTSNRFKADQDNDSVNDYLYDSSGNLTKNAQGREFTFNAENLQITATASGLSMTYSYDGNNQRVKSYDAVNDNTTIFVYDASGRLAAEYTVNVSPPTVTTISYLTEDALGSVRVSTNSFAEVKARRDFLPFGEELYAGIANRNTNQKYSSSTDDLRKKFATYQRDAETGLDFAQSRYYAPMHGRFTSPDEFKGGPDELFDFEEDATDNPTLYADLTNPQSLNKYQYAYNNPYKFADPTGHCPWGICVWGDKVGRLADAATKTAIGGAIIAVASAAGDTVVETVSRSLRASANAGIGDPSCPSCTRSQQIFANQNAESQGSQPKPRPQPKVGGEAGGSQGKLRGSRNPVVAKAAAEGRKRHAELKKKIQAKPGWTSEPPLRDPKTGKIVKPDGLTKGGNPLEYKPDTPSGRRAGERQLPAQERAAGKKGRVIYYKPNP